MSHRDITKFQVICRKEIENFLSQQDYSANEETYIQMKVPQDQ